MSTIEKSRDFYLNIARRLVSNTNGIVKFGRNPNVNISSQDLWGVGGTWVQPTAARLHDVKSSNVNDTELGTGARSVVIIGLDANYEAQTETVVLNGTSNVATVGLYIMINRMYVATAGNDATNDGNITATAQTDATVTAQINAGAGDAQQAIYQVAANYTSYLVDLCVSVQAADSADISIELMVKPFGGAWLSMYQLNLQENGSSSAVRKFPIPLVFTEKSLVKLRCSSNANATDISGSFTLANLENNV